MFPIKDLNFLSCTPFFHQVLQRTRSVQHTNNHFFGFIFGDGSDAILWIFQLSKVIFGFSFRFVQTWIDWIFPFSDLKVWQSWIFATCQRMKAPIWFQTSNLSFFLHTDFSPHRFGTKALRTSIKLHKLFRFCIGGWNMSSVYFLAFCNLPKNDGADMIAGCRPGADMIGASAPMWLAACVWTLQYPEFRQFSSFCHNSTNMIRTSQCELFNIRSFDNSFPPLCHKSTNVIRTSQCELSNNANFDILYIHVLFRISTSVQHLLGLIRVLKDFN